MCRALSLESLVDLHGRHVITCPGLRKAKYDEIKDRQGLREYLGLCWYWVWRLCRCD